MFKPRNPKPYSHQYKDTANTIRMLPIYMYIRTNMLIISKSYLFYYGQVHLSYTVYFLAFGRKLDATLHLPAIHPLLDHVSLIARGGILIFSQSVPNQLVIPFSNNKTFSWDYVRPTCHSYRHWATYLVRL